MQVTNHLFNISNNFGVVFRSSRLCKIGENILSVNIIKQRIQQGSEDAIYT